MSLSSITFFVVALVLLALLIAAVFRSGKRAEVMANFPLIQALFWTFGIQLMMLAGDWIREKDGRASLADRLENGAILLFFGVIVWFIGFFVGRKNQALPR